MFNKNRCENPKECCILFEKLVGRQCCSGEPNNTKEHLARCLGCHTKTVEMREIIPEEPYEELIRRIGDTTAKLIKPNS